MNVVDKLEQGIAEYKAGRKDQARAIFLQFIKEQPTNIKGYEALYRVALSDYERVEILNKILEINPYHPTAKKMLDELKSKSTAAPSQVSSTAPIQTKTDPNQNKNLITGMVAIIALCFICFCIYSYSDFGGSEPDYKTAAYVLCQVYVENQLKAPSTADFPASSQVNIQELANNTFQISSYVDAENSFGAMIRTDYLCKIQYTGPEGGDEYEGNNWKLLDLQIYE